MLTDMGADIIKNPAVAKERLLEAFRAATDAVISSRQTGEQAATNIKRAVAEKFGASERSVYRWITRLDAWDDLDAITSEKDLRIPGPPRTRDKIIGAIVTARGNVNRAARDLGMSRAELLEKLAIMKLYERTNAALKAAGHPTLSQPKEAA